MRVAKLEKFFARTSFRAANTFIELRVFRLQAVATIIFLFSPIRFSITAAASVTIAIAHAAGIHILIKSFPCLPPSAHTTAVNKAKFSDYRAVAYMYNKWATDDTETLQNQLQTVTANITYSIIA